MRTALRLAVLLVLALAASVPARAQSDAHPGPVLLRPDRVFDGADVRAGWVVLVEGERIAAAGPEGEVAVPDGAGTLDLPGMTLLPGLIEAHAHLFLHPYNETPWTEQVLKEPQALRVARATVHARRTLEAGITTERDLGTEGAGYADLGLKQAVERGVIPGPRLLIASRAIVATGSYGPKGFDPDWDVPLGAEPADGADLIRVVRDQIGKGADWVKVYADYRWGPGGEALPTFTLDELETLVEVAASAGRPVAAHAATAEGMRRAVLAGAQTIEHGDGGTPEVWALMRERGVALCPTLAAADAIARYGGWEPGRGPEPERIGQKRASFKAALEAGVTICHGSDVGVFSHGEAGRELALMVDYGMTPGEALAAATSVNAEILHLEEEIGRVAPGLVADLIAVEGNPVEDIGAITAVRLVMKGGKVVVRPDSTDSNGRP